MSHSCGPKDKAVENNIMLISNYSDGDQRSARERDGNGSRYPARKSRVPFTAGPGKFRERAGNISQRVETGGIAKISGSRFPDIPDR